MSSGWFNYTEPSLATSLQGKQVVRGAYALVRGGSSTANLLEPHHHRDSTFVSQEFGVFLLSSNFIFTEERCAGCLGTCSGWFQRIEPPQTTASQR